MRNLQRLCVGLGVFALLCVGGCTREFFFSNARVDSISNPQVGPAAVVLKVTDMRKFEDNPNDIQTPTVRRTEDLANKAVTSRAAGKARNSGHTLFFTYDPGQSVEAAVQGAVENALRRKGYVVVEKDTPSAANAIPVEVDIRKCWLYWIPGFWTIQSDYDVEVDVKSSALFEKGAESAKGHHNIDSGFMAPAVCEHCIGDGLDELTKDLETKLKSAK